ncbi:MAG: sigma-54-dependent Fis family transcriptional regulator [Deltaproteobacteria bacterium]|nr:sigma-54-dependent Fis family transcriptional regulator [Deltaproteobacteria bacterium]
MRSPQVGENEVIGNSPQIRKVRELVAKASRSDANVVIIGETGTGKELVARALHANSSRRSARFVAVNCAELDGGVTGSELFGHRRGAFTGAIASRRGLLAAADGGTLFLDEIAELSVRTQAKLLRALQEREVRPVGGDAGAVFDARLVTATNRPLEWLVASGALREDFYYRISVITIEVPTLRERGDDVLLLAEHFVQMFAAKCRREITGLSSAGRTFLLQHPWPGNVRQLMNCIESAVALAPGPLLDFADLVVRNTPPAGVSAALIDSTCASTPVSHDGASDRTWRGLECQEPRDVGSSSPPVSASDRGVVRFDDTARTAIEHALVTTDRNVSAAARKMGMSRGRLVKMMRRLKIRAAR